MQKRKEKEKNDKAKNLKWATLSDFAAADAISAYPVSANGSWPTVTHERTK